MWIFRDTKRRGNPDAPCEGYSKTPLDLLEEIPEPTPPADYSDETYYRTEQDDAPYVVYTRKSDEQIAAIMLNKAKQARIAEVAAIVVTVGTNQFDGNEDAQNRMARAAVAMSDTDQIPWVLADSQVAIVTKAELLEALRLAGAAMAAIWVRPYQ